MSAASATDLSGAAAPADAYWAAIGQGRLTFQRCAACGEAWLPPRSECPRCWAAEWRWEEAGGAGRVVSWVVYHVAFHEGFRDRLPYNVAVVELAEGPRLVTNIIDLPPAEDVIGRAVALIFQEDRGRALPRFRLADVP